jgi:DNA-binding PadR family transcriptional regulator
LLSRLLSARGWISLSYMCRVSFMRMTGPLERVLGAFLADPAEPRYGYDLMKAARLPSGTLYPLLARLERENLVASAWETPQQEGERPRKYYQLTGEGIRIARLELAQASARRQRAPARTGRPAPGSLG